MLFVELNHCLSLIIAQHIRHDEGKKHSFYRLNFYSIQLILKHCEMAPSGISFVLYSQSTFCNFFEFSLESKCSNQVTNLDLKKSEFPSNEFKIQEEIMEYINANVNSFDNFIN